MMLAVFLITLLLLIAIGVPTVFALIATGAVMSIISLGDPAPQIMAQGLYRGIDSYPLLAIPFFLLAGEIMNKGGISRRIVELSRVLLGQVSGGLGFAAVASGGIFAAITGSAVASVSALGRILIPAMRDEGYDVDESGALNAAAATLGPIIPPSIPMILYGVNANVSILGLFLGGVVPGLLIMIGLMVVWAFHAKKQGYPKAPRASFREMFRKTMEASLALLLPVIILGLIVAGIATPTESAVVAVVYALVVTLFVYKDLKFSDLKGVFIQSGKVTAMVMIFVGGATAVSYMITTEQIPGLLSSAILGLSSNTYVVLILVVILLLIIGMFMDVAPAVLIMTPILVPMMNDLGVDLLMFGVLMCVTLVVGLITPPVGAVLYIASSIADRNALRITASLLPYLAVMVGVIVLMVFFGGLITGLPALVIG